MTTSPLCAQRVGYHSGPAKLKPREAQTPPSSRRADSVMRCHLRMAHLLTADLLNGDDYCIICRHD